MRLLKASTVASEAQQLELVEFVGREVPGYAILSHTWGEDEVLYEDVATLSARKRKAFPKVKYAAEQTRKDGLDFIWIDTCCINKSSSAELQEAINSMYRWYQGARVCYVYLEDVDSNLDHQLRHSRWFQRG